MDENQNCAKTHNESWKHTIADVDTFVGGDDHKDGVRFETHHDESDPTQYQDVKEAQLPFQGDVEIVAVPIVFRNDCNLRCQEPIFFLRLMLQ